MHRRNNLRNFVMVASAATFATLMTIASWEREPLISRARSVMPTGFTPMSEQEVQQLQQTAGMVLQAIIGMMGGASEFPETTCGNLGAGSGRRHA